MQYNYQKINIFAEEVLRDVLEHKKNNIIGSIKSENDNYILNVNENEYIKHKISDAYIEPIEILEEHKQISTLKKMIPAKYFPFSYCVRSGKSYEKDVIKIHIPYSGNSRFLSCKPSTFLMWNLEIEIENNEICFEIINFNNDSKEIENKINNNIQNILKQQKNVNNEIEKYNNSMKIIIKETFQNIKKQILEKNNFLSSLNIPIKKNEKVSKTFTVPISKSKDIIKINKPIVKEKNYSPEPVLDNETYFDILKLINDVGKEFERLPGVYKDKKEEDLRDHFLMMLEPNFEGSATGETFNKKGKTDILLRYEGNNVFIGECKFWKGKEILLDTISQLLKYLTWRDSKAAIIFFVKNKDFSTVIHKVKENISKHSNFLDYKNDQDLSWFNYEFHINDDPNRKVKLAVMLYHLP